MEPVMKTMKKMKNLDISEKEDNKGYTGRPKEF